MCNFFLKESQPDGSLRNTFLNSLPLTSECRQGSSAGVLCPNQIQRNRQQTWGSLQQLELPSPYTSLGLPAKHSKAVDYLMFCATSQEMQFHHLRHQKAGTRHDRPWAILRVLRHGRRFGATAFVCSHTVLRETAESQARYELEHMLHLQRVLIFSRGRLMIFLLHFIITLQYQFGSIQI